MLYLFPRFGIGRGSNWELFFFGCWEVIIFFPLEVCVVKVRKLYCDSMSIIGGHNVGLGCRCKVRISFYVDSAFRKYTNRILDSTTL